LGGRTDCEENTLSDRTSQSKGEIFIHRAAPFFVTKNWRLTFRIDKTEIEIIDLDDEDYHQEVAMNAITGIRMKNPAHPGGFVKSEIVEALELSVTDAAKALGVTRPALSALLNERAALASEMALRIEKAFGVSMDTLMRMQNSYDIAQARRRAGQIKMARFRKVGDPARRWRDRLGMSAYV
jgi:addiction module HigA family antidote